MSNYTVANQVYEKQYEFAKLAFEKKNILPRRYVLVLTNLCNLRCSFCFQERKKRSDRMLFEDWINVINQIPNDSRITLTGGEPLVFKEFDIIFKKSNERSETNIVTNGLLLDKKKINLFKEEKNFKILGISIDTIGNVNRDFKKGQWDNLLNNIKDFIVVRDLGKHKIALDIKTVILEENIKDLFKIHKFCCEVLKADTHSLQMLKGASIQHSDIMFDFKQIDADYEAYQYKNFKTLIDQLNLIKEYNYKNNQRAYLHPNLISLNDNFKILLEDFDYINRKTHEPKYFSQCYAPWSSVHINVDGNLFPCMAVSMGNVKNEKIKDIIYSEKFMNFKDIIRKNKTINGCNRCGWLRSANHK
jgi:radical SAM protein with 4Fe4S-binding SPASM domain